VSEEKTVEKLKHFITLMYVTYFS